MPGMYPDDQLLEIFGEQIFYPGLHPETHKFTDGDFANPLIKPSHIPAATMNLLIDNMASVIESIELIPNNAEPDQLKKALQKGFAPRVIGEYHLLSYQPTVAELVRLRYLPLQYQLVEIDLYQELCALKYVGDDKNDTADWWYKCDENETRNINGLFMRVEDPRGLFFRIAGQNAIKTASNNAPYDGGDIGEFESFGTMGPPDYVNIESTNRINTNNGTWTVDRDGYVRIGYTPANNGWAGLDIENVFLKMTGLSASANLTLRDVLTVSKDTTLRLSNVLNGNPTGGTPPECYFVPQRHNKGSLAASVYITY
jgi:hypothetical protein